MKNISNLFSSLFTYRELEQISPLENFTTEILCYLLENNHEVRKFFLRKCGFEEFEQAGSVINSQFGIKNGQIDILIRGDNNRYAIAIENKIDSGFQPNQIKKYKEFINGISSKGFVIALIKNEADFNTEIGIPDRVIYWFEFSKFLKVLSRKHENEILNECLSFLKEEEMAIDKVGWALVDGLEAKQNLLNMIKLVLGRIEVLKQFKYKGISSGAKEGSWEEYEYRIPDKNIEFDICLVHADATLYFFLRDKKNNYGDRFPAYHIWKANKIVGKFDFRKEHFFPLDEDEQEEKLMEFIKSCLQKIKGL